MIEATVRVCILDGTPPHESACYRTLCEAIGERKARRWLEDVTVTLNHPPPEVENHDMDDHRITLGDVAQDQSKRVI